METGLVSVVIPVYNGEMHLRQCLESVLNQTHTRREIIAVNDGSTDGSQHILDFFHDRVTTLRQSNSGSVGLARNAGLARATGEFVAVLDQDDWWASNKLARQLELFEDPRVGLVHTAVSYFDESSQAMVGPQDPEARPAAMVGGCYERLLLGNPIVNSSVVIRRCALETVGYCDPQIAGNTVQDYDLWLRIAKADFLFGFVPEPVTYFRLHTGQGHKDRRMMLSEELKALLRHREVRSWQGSFSGRQRMARLLDELATAHFDAGDGVEARKCFAQAFRRAPGCRSLLRFAASCLPYGIGRRLRDAWQATRVRV